MGCTHSSVMLTWQRLQLQCNPLNVKRMALFVLRESNMDACSMDFHADWRQYDIMSYHVM